MDVFIVEDSKIVSDELKAMFSEIPGVEVIGHAVDEQGAIERIGAARPDVVILDIALNPGSGINVLRVIKKRHPGIKVVVLTNYTDECYASRCTDAGADYFFDKSLQFMRVGALLRQLLTADDPDNRPVALQK